MSVRKYLAAIKLQYTKKFQKLKIKISRGNK